MKKILFSISALVMLTFTAMAQTNTNVMPKAGPAPQINIADAQSFTLDNGLKVFVVENHKLPRVTYSIQLDINPVPENDKAGIRGIVGSLITAGTTNRTKAQFDEQTDMIGASIGASSTGIYGQSLVKHQESLLSLMSDAVKNANFQQSELDRLIKQTESGLATSINDPSSMLSNMKSVVLYGKGHPYGDVTTEETVKNITLNDCNNYYKTYFRPNVAYMAVVGDITLEEAKKLVTKYFGDWEKSEVPSFKYPDAPKITHTQVDFVARSGAVQSNISIAYPVDLPIGSEDVIKTRVLNEILGGSSQGRLFLNLRETHGWTYGAYSNINPDRIKGDVSLTAECRNEVTDSAIVEMIKEANRLRTELVPNESIQAAINYISGRFAIGLENPQTLAQYAINIERFNLPKDYYKNYLKEVAKVNAQDLMNAANKYLNMDKARIFVVGSAEIAPKLAQFTKNDKINYYDNYGNSIEPVETKSADGIKVQDVLDKYIQAIGGKETIMNLKDLIIVGKLEQMGQRLDVKIVTVSPNKFKQSISMMGQEYLRQVLNGDKGYVEQAGQRMDLPAEAIEGLAQQADLQEILHPEKYGITYNLVGIEKQDKDEIYVVEKIDKDGTSKTVQHYDVSSGLLIKEISNMEAQGQIITSIKTMSNYKEVKDGNGYKIPFTIQDNGTMNMKISVTSAKANSGVKDSEFK